MLKFTHINIVAQDWQKLADFYCTVFNCEKIYPERDLKGKWIDKITNISKVHIKGIHLKVPGYGNEGPTIEIFQYNKTIESPGKKINQPGFAHIAFAVDDVELYLSKILKAGGGQIGEIVRKEIDNVGTIELVYVTDPENNIIELQRWL